MNPQPGQHAKIRDAGSGATIDGRIHRVYQLGLTAEDARGILHYATFDRVLSVHETKPAPKPEPVGVFD